MRNVLFYHLFLTNNGKPISASVKKFFIQILAIPYKDRICDIDGYPVVLSLKNIEPMTKQCFYTMVRFKSDAHLFTGSLTDEKLEEIKGDIAQLTTFLYDEKTNVLIEEYNHEGIKHKEILLYFNQFIKNSGIKLHAIQINENYSINNIVATSRIASIEIKLKLDKTKLDILKDQDSKFSTLCEVFNSDKNDTLEADFVSVMFRKNRSKTLNIESAVTLLKVLDVSNDSIQSVIVQFKHKGKTVSMDIKDVDKPLKDKILEDSSMKNPFLVSIREGLLMIYIEKHAGRFDSSSKELISKMEKNDLVISIKRPPQQRNLV